MVHAIFYNYNTENNGKGKGTEMLFDDKELDALISCYRQHPDEDVYTYILKNLKNRHLYMCEYLLTTEFGGRVYFEVYTYIDEEMEETDSYFITDIDDIVKIIEEETEHGYKIGFVSINTPQGFDFTFPVKDYVGIQGSLSTETKEHNEHLG